MAVCTTCRPPGAARALPAQGITLFEALQDARQAWLHLVGSGAA
jgi:hypothetical protein